MRRKVGLIYWIAGAMGKRVEYGKALTMAERFTEAELCRIYRRVRARTT